MIRKTTGEHLHRIHSLAVPYMKQVVVAKFREEWRASVACLTVGLRQANETSRLSPTPLMDSFNYVWHAPQQDYYQAM